MNTEPYFCDGTSLGIEHLALSALYRLLYVYYMTARWAKFQPTLLTHCTALTTQ